MTAIPRAALWLGLAGLVPFLAAALLALTGMPLDALLPWLPLPPTGAGIAVHYGIVILCFMSGVLWGFATRAEGRAATLGYALSVLPALWAFFTTAADTGAALVSLSLGFLGLLVLDWHFWLRGLAPAWWMRLRILLTTIVVVCLLLAMA